MIDIVVPDGNEKELISMAEKLGFSGLCLCYSKLTSVSDFQSDTKLKLVSGVICDVKDVSKYREKAVVFVRAPDDQGKIRHVIEQVRPNVVFGLEMGKRRDFMHHRASGLNHIISVLCCKNDVSVGLALSEVIGLRSWRKAQVLGRAMQNIRFMRKFGFKIVVGSFATSVWGMRGPLEIAGLLHSLGMTGSEVKKSWLELE